MAKGNVATSSWQGNGLSREVLSIRSGETELYGSFYAGTASTGPGVVICPPWGAEARHGNRTERLFARSVAERGGRSLVFDWPGQGESEGEPSLVTLEHLIRAACDAAAALKERFGQSRVVLAGLRLGAAVAAIVAPNISPDALILMQPVWDPIAHFDSVEKASARATLGKSSTSGWAFGDPLPLKHSFEGSGTQLVDALDSYAGPTVALGYGFKESPPIRLECIDVPGDWRHALATNDARLTDAAVKWLRERVG